MIDIVVLYCDDNDPKWKESFNYYKNLEITTGQANIKNRQAFGDERYRDWEVFKYWFRGVEINCSWFNKIFLVVANEDQVPKWLNTTNPKLRIVYHDEFIPKELLPTFNATTIELYLSYIKDLSDVYVFCNDDFYFINKTPSTYFFRDNKLVYGTNEMIFHYFNRELEKGTDGTFYKGLNNCRLLQKTLANDNKAYGFSHLPMPHSTPFEKQILTFNSQIFINAQISSRFRHKTNYASYVFDCLYRALNDYIQDDIYKNSKYVTLKSTVNFNEYANCDMVCFNDTEQLDDFEKTKRRLITFFENKFPNKSSFEKDI